MLIQLNVNKRLFLVFPFLILVLSGCTDKNYDFYTGTQNDDRLIQLFKLLDQADDIDNQENMEKNYIIIKMIISEYEAVGETDKMNLFLTNYIHTHKNDPYISLYLLTIAQYYQKEDAQQIAETYFRQILYNYPDLIIKEKSIHKLILEELAYKSNNPEERISCFNDLLYRFPGEIDKGIIYYYLSKSYEELGIWDKVYETYEKFLKSPEVEINGDPKARIRISKLLNFHKSDKSWTVRELDSLVNSIRYAISRQNGKLLNRYRGTPFFCMNWTQEETDDFTEYKFQLTSFLSSKPKCSSKLDPMSSENEAFLRTYGWSIRINVWYLCFRKIEYPVDPEINGRWEWAGIYIGNPL